MVEAPGAGGYSRDSKPGAVLPTNPIAAFWARNHGGYAKQGPPLMPVAADIAALERCVGEWARREGRSPRALLMGVTPAIARMAWPAGSSLVAMDWAPNMIRDIWPKQRPIASWAVCADWNDMPLERGTIDMAFNDGGFTLVAFPASYRRIFAHLHRIMTPRGLAAIRFHLRPDRAERPAAVIDDLRAGRIGSFHVFRWRLVASVQDSAPAGVRLGDVFETWHGAMDGGSLAQSWPPQAVELMTVYRGGEARYFFPTLAELRAVAGEYFREVSVEVQSYELGERCPTVLLRRR